MLNPDLEDRAHEIKMKYWVLIEKFSKCHNNYSHARPVTLADITTLGEFINMNQKHIGTRNLKLVFRSLSAVSESLEFSDAFRDKDQFNLLENFVFILIFSAHLILKVLTAKKRCPWTLNLYLALIAPTLKIAFLLSCCTPSVVSTLLSCCILLTNEKEVLQYLNQI